MHEPSTMAIDRVARADRRHQVGADLHHQQADAEAEPQRHVVVPAEDAAALSAQRRQRLVGPVVRVSMCHPFAPLQSVWQVGEAPAAKTGTRERRDGRRTSFPARGLPQSGSKGLFSAGRSMAAAGTPSVASVWRSSSDCRAVQVLVVLQPVARNDLRAAAADAVVVGLEELALVQRLQAIRSAAAPASCPAGRGRPRPGRSSSCTGYQGWRRRVARAARHRARRAAPRSGPARRTASRGSSSGCRAPRPCRSRATRRGARSAGAPGRAGRCSSRNRIRSSPSTRTLRGVALASAARPTGCQ